MKTILIYFILIIFSTLRISAQKNYTVIGKIMDIHTNKHLIRAEINIKNHTFSSFTDEEGFFRLTHSIQGKHILKFSKSGYQIKHIEIVFEDLQLIDLGIVYLKKLVNTKYQEDFIFLSDNEILEVDNGDSNSITGLLIASKDLFQKTVSYEFSPTFFRQRNLGNEYAQVMINGVLMNKLFNRRPQWGNWGGLNDVLRTQEFFPNMSVSDYGFGGFSGTVNLVTQASTFKKGLRVSFASSNRNYRGRIMATYSSGRLKNDWAITVSASKRYANQGFREGTNYDANSFFLSIEKKLNQNHRINFTGIYASNIRGRSSPNTAEVENLKTIKYNSFWGNQVDKMRNSRQRKIEEPILQLSHFWKMKGNNSLQTNITYQFGMVENSRIDYGGTRIIEDTEGNPIIIGGGTNPDPAYYQKLPSYFLRDINNPDYENAYLAEQEFLKNGQLNWAELYEANQLSVALGGNSVYALYDDRNDDKQLIINSIYDKRINKNFAFNAAADFKILKSENFAFMKDLLGGNGFLDVDFYADNIVEAQNDLRNPNRLVGENQKFKYNYNIDATVFNGFTQLRYKTRKTESFLALNYTNTTYQREGKYENGAYPGNLSYGKSKAVNFQNYGIKGGFLFKPNGRHIFSANLSYATMAPTIQNSFSNMRENNDIVIDLKSQKIAGFDINYNARLPFLTTKVSGYLIDIRDQTDISFYFADGLVGLNNAESTAFVQEVLTGIETLNYGLELAIEVPIFEGFKIKGVAAVGQSIYNNNPNLYLTSDSFKEPITYGKVYLKNYFVSGGPQYAYSFGFEYNNPEYWWVGLTGNFFDNAFINIAPITRTRNFYLDNDGLPINDFDEETAKKILRQEKFKPYYLFNIVGGKSWKIKKYYFGIFANISNLFNTKYKTGGFEQSRNANYTTLLEDYNRDKPLFGPKYWFGYGSSYYFSLYFRM